MSTAVTLELDDTTLKAFDDYAVSLQRPRDELVKEALASWLELQAWQLSEIEKGLAEADAGNFASDEEVAAVFAKYGVDYFGET